MQLENILVIDDSETDQYLVKRVLKSITDKTNIIQIFDGKSGLDYLKDVTEKPDTTPMPQLILLDIEMPILDGFGVLEGIKKLQQTSTVFEPLVVVMFTSDGTEESERRALKYDSVKGYLVKPTTQDDLTAIIHQHF